MQKRCVSISSDIATAGEWYKGPCSEKNGKICVQPKKNQTNDSPNRCENGGIRHLKACYKVFNEKKRWEDAEKECQKENYNLTSIDNIFEQNFLLALVNKSEDFWIGLSNRRVSIFNQ